MGKDAWQEQLVALVLENEDQAVARCLELSQRLGGSSDPQVRNRVVHALLACAQELTGRSYDKSALTVVQELRSRFADDPSPRIMTLVAGSLSLAADLHVRGGQLEAALASYDDGLSLVAGFDELERRGVDATLLLEKGRVLGKHERREEAVVVLDSALAALARSTASKPVLRTRQVAVAVTSKLHQLCALDRFAEAGALTQQLEDALSEIPGANADEGAPGPGGGAREPEASEATLAAAVADFVNDGECWTVFAGSLAISPAEAAQRACHLYEIAAPWTLADVSESVEAAAALVRLIADGYALLAGQWSTTERASLPLPIRAELERHELLHERGLSDWCQQNGHPLNLAVDLPDAETAQEPPPAAAGPSGTSAVDAQVRRTIIELLCFYDLADVLSQSEFGREALRYKVFSVTATRSIRFAMSWGRNVNAHGASDGRLAVAVVCLLIAEGLFAAAHCQSGGSRELFPGKERLLGLLHEAGGYEWLTGLDASLPAWTHPEDI